MKFENIKMKSLANTFTNIIPVGIPFVIQLVSHPVMANRLESAAQRGQSFLLSVGQITSVVGLLIGGVLMSLGAGHIGKMVLISGLIGALMIFGAPAVIEVVRGIFQ